MKVKTSITLSPEILAALDQVHPRANRSQLIEDALWEFIGRRAREARDRRDREIIERHADALNKEALDALSYQVES